MMAECRHNRTNRTGGRVVVGNLFGRFDERPAIVQDVTAEESRFNDRHVYTQRSELEVERFGQPFNRKLVEE